MKKYLSLLTIIIVAITLISWGFKGHQAVALIAENHLTPKAKAAVKELLGNQSLADIASWADEVRNQPAYKQTGPLHYVDLPLGLSYEQFISAVDAQGDNNVFGALLKYQKILTSKETTKEEKSRSFEVCSTLCR